MSKLLTSFAFCLIFFGCTEDSDNEKKETTFYTECAPCEILWSAEDNAWIACVNKCRTCTVTTMGEDCAAWYCDRRS